MLALSGLPVYSYTNGISSGSVHASHSLCFHLPLFLSQRVSVSLLVSISLPLCDSYTLSLGLYELVSLWVSMFLCPPPDEHTILYLLFTNCVPYTTPTSSPQGPPALLAAVSQVANTMC